MNSPTLQFGEDADASAVVAQLGGGHGLGRLGFERIGGGGLLAQDGPGHVGAKFFTGDWFAVTLFDHLLARGAFDRWTVLGRHTPVGVEPGPDMAPVGESAGACDRRLAAQKLGGAIQRGLFGLKVRAHAR